ncbi:hypothetical protein BX666DRAFT_1956671 [Dichotomocladium elegans]|nr:hypothetical protein BX666DRAFT_1956671 [Dichotomocladium elegans]
MMRFLRFFFLPPSLYKRRGAGHHQIKRQGLPFLSYFYLICIAIIRLSLIMFLATLAYRNVSFNPSSRVSRSTTCLPPIFLILGIFLHPSS